MSWVIPGRRKDTCKGRERGRSIIEMTASRLACLDHRLLEKDDLSGDVNGPD